MMGDNAPKFEGFRRPEKHFYHMPNEWTDIMAGIDNLAELKVLEYLIRHTWGFKEYDEFKFITIDEFMNGRLRADGTRMDKGTGLKSDRSVKDGLNAAIEHGYVLCEPNTKAKVRKSYKPKMQKVVSTQDVGSIYPPKTQDLPTDKVVSTRISPSGVKETEIKEKEREKERLIHSSTLSSDCLKTVSEFAKLYGDSDSALYQELAQRVYQRYKISDNEFHDYLYHAQAASSKTKLMSDFFEKLQRMLDKDFKAKGEN